MCDRMCVDLKLFENYINTMFPYTDEENAWISGIKISKVIKKSNRSLFLSLSTGLVAALASTLIPPFIYFSRLGLL